MKLDMVGIVTKNMDQSIKFYETLGFKALGTPNDEYVELNNNGVRISLNTSKMLSGIYGYNPDNTGDKIELAFLCDSPKEVDDLHDKIVKCGYESFKEPWDAFWGQRYAIIKDIDGHLLSIFSNLPTK